MTLVASWFYTAAITSKGRLLAWGSDKDGHCSNVPPLVAGETFVKLAAGWFHRAAITCHGRLIAWGLDKNGQCSMVPPLDADEIFTKLAAGAFHTAGITSKGRLLAWGRDEDGQCSKVPLLEGDETFKKLAAGKFHTAAITSKGRLLAWGLDEDGQCSKVPFLQPGETFMKLAAGKFHTAAITSTGRLLAWGLNEDGQCSNVPLLEAGETFTKLAAGGAHTAAITSKGRLLAWGRDQYGQCSSVPKIDAAETFMKLPLGWFDTDGIISQGRLLALGCDREAQGSNASSLEAGERFMKLAAGEFHIAAITSKDRLLAWGRDEDDQSSRGPSLESCETLVPSQLHIAAYFGDLESCKKLVQAGAVVRSRDMKGRTPMDLAERGGHRDVIRYLQQFLYISTMRGGSGSAKETALADAKPVTKVDWYTLKMDATAGQLGVLHSILAVTVSNGIGTSTYTIEKAMQPDGEALFDNGVFVSHWEEVLPCIEDEPIHELNGAGIQRRGGAELTMQHLHDVALEMGPYNVATCNCHHMALKLYNLCADEDFQVDSASMPNINLSYIASLLGVFMDLGRVQSSAADSPGLADESCSTARSRHASEERAPQASLCMGSAIEWVLSKLRRRRLEVGSQA